MLRCCGPHACNRTRGVEKRPSRSLEAHALLVLQRAAHDRRLLWLAAAVAGLCIVQAGYAALDWNWGGYWNDVRVARAYAVAGGADIYGSANQGVLPGHLYGPVGFFLYAPVRLASTPGGAIRMGVALSALLALAPLALAFGWRRRGVPEAALALAAFLHLYWSPVAGTLWSVHVDAPAIGLILLSWIGLARAAETAADWRWPALAGVAAAAAVWAKQTAVPALLLPPVLLWLAGKRGRAAAAAGWGLGCAAGLGALFGWLWGFEDLWFTMFEVPGRHGRYVGRLLADFTELGTLLDLAPLIAIPLILGRRGPAGRDSRRARLALIYCLALIPFAALGRLKISGAVNNYLGPDVFATLAVCLAAAAALRRPRNGGAVRRRACALLGLALLAQVTRTSGFLAHEAVRQWQSHPTAASDEAFAYARAHPGDAYFPWNPLATLMAEGRLYHSGHGAVGRRQAGLLVSDAQWRAHVPKQARYVMLPAGSRPDFHEVMPEYSKRVELAEMPRWDVWARTAAEGSR